MAKVLFEGVPGQAYNVGGGNDRTNREITDIILRELDLPQSVVKHVEDRPGHDRRYSLDSGKLRGLGWEPAMPFEEGIVATIRWYRDNRGWWERIKSGEAFGEWREQWYAGRE